MMTIQSLSDHLDTFLEKDQKNHIGALPSRIDHPQVVRGFFRHHRITSKKSINSNWKSQCSILAL